MILNRFWTIFEVSKIFCVLGCGRPPGCTPAAPRKLPGDFLIFQNNFQKFNICFMYFLLLPPTPDDR